MSDSLGNRIATLRVQHGFTQQELAERLAISRTAVSHLEAGISIPGERTVTLLAGLFKIDPAELIAKTSYPLAKAERLPSIACRYTEAELQARLVQRDCEWLQQIRNQAGWSHIALDICQRGFDQLAVIAQDDPRERAILATARTALETLYAVAMSRIKENDG